MTASARTTELTSTDLVNVTRYRRAANYLERRERLLLSRELVCRHQVDRWPPQDALAVIFALAQHHLIEGEHVVDRRDKSAPTGFENGRLRDDATALRCRHRLHSNHHVGNGRLSLRISRRLRSKLGKENRQMPAAVELGGARPQKGRTH
jgi:hypothetical protein